MTAPPVPPLQEAVWALKGALIQAEELDFDGEYIQALKIAIRIVQQVRKETL